jgi:hypothetical protein
MSFSQYGPFLNVVTIASALVATFSVLLLKMFGSLKRWTWLTSGAPSFIITAAARALAVALMALTYVTINKSNYRWFGAGAVLCGVVAFWAIARFERMRERHVATIPQVGADGKQLLDRKKKPVNQNVVVGTDADLREDARTALAAARKKSPGLSVRQFMSGFGPQRVNDPDALWDSNLLADIRSNMTITLMYAALLGVMALFLAAFTIEIFQSVR